MRHPASSFHYGRARSAASASSRSARAANALIAASALTRSWASYAVRSASRSAKSAVCFSSCSFRVSTWASKPLMRGVSCALSSATRKGLSFPSRDPLSFPSRMRLVSPSGIWIRARLSLPRVRGQRQRMALCLTASMFDPRRLAASLYVSHSTSIGARPSQTPIERAYRVWLTICLYVSDVVGGPRGDGCGSLAVLAGPA